ncbi:Uncharacterised protein [Mycobacteroides abscessus subsp. abscessus]|nr:Uncharacterised protein [Mycobacteroides abscessus subsp. abscessus]
MKGRSQGARSRPVDAVAYFGPVERDGDDRPVDLVEHRPGHDYCATTARSSEVMSSWMNSIFSSTFGGSTNGYRS